MESIEYRGYTIKLKQDGDPQNPRTEWDNACKMVCLHKRYSLGDKHDYRSSDFDGWESLKNQILSDEDVAIIKPLYMYDHGGITIATVPFSCPWDSGQIGFIYLTKKTVKEEWSGDLRAAEKYLDCEVKTYDDYVTGSVYGFIIEDKTGEHVDSCWGFYGDPMEYCLSEAKSAVDYTVNKDRKEHIENVKRFIRNKVPLHVRERILA